MVAERFFIFRFGTSDACALTAAKDGLSLPREGGEDWRYFMLVTRNQVEDGAFGFNFASAVSAIKRQGFFKFKGTANLLFCPHPFGILASHA